MHALGAAPAQPVWAHSNAVWQSFTCVLSPRLEALLIIMMPWWVFVVFPNGSAKSKNHGFIKVVSFMKLLLLQVSLSRPKTGNTQSTLWLEGSPDTLARYLHRDHGTLNHRTPPCEHHFQNAPRELIHEKRLQPIGSRRVGIT
jgi:hypothetical protein